jgi:hypothetical protein
MFPGNIQEASSETWCYMPTCTYDDRRGQLAQVCRHGRRERGAALFTGPWRSRFDALASRGLLTVDESAGEVALTVGETLVEAVIDTELDVYQQST